MEQNNRTCPFGDCPGLDSGPRSREHGERFSRHDTRDRMIKKGSMTTEKDVIAQNAVKRGAQSS